MGWYEERFEDLNGRKRQDCVVCGRPMWFPACKHGKYLTCGGECAKARWEAQKQERARPCKTCGAEFIPRLNQLRAGHGVYCSQKCNEKSRAALNSPEAQRRSKIGWRATFNARPFLPRGPNHPKWNGGPEAARVRNLGRVRVYKKRNAEKLRAWSANRRRREGAKLPASVARDLFRLQKGKCAICRCKLPKGYHLDHIEPLARGGTNDRHNVQLLCPTCNTRKGAKDPIAYMQSRGFLL